MLDWRVAEQLPDDPTTDDVPAVTTRRPGNRVVLVGALLVLVIVVSGLSYTYRQRDVALRSDLSTYILDETRAQAAGDVSLAEAYADPNAPEGWYAHYASQFRSTATLPALVVQDVRLAGELAEVDVAWQTTPPYMQHRAYRSVNGQWRRTPLVVATEPITDTRTPYFVITGPVPVVNDLTNTPGLQLNLEALRGRIVTYWGDDIWDAYLLTVAVYPSDLAPAVEFSDARRLHINTPTLTPFDPASPLSPQSQYRLTVTDAVVKWLTTPQWVRDLQLGNTTMSPADVAASHDWMVMLDLLQQAEARQWVLNDAERRAVRNAWRAELNHQWVDPFTARLPLTNTPATYDARLRWVMVNLMIERQITVGGPEMVGRLAQMLKSYPSVYFDPATFFRAIAGGTPDVPQQMEMYLADEP